MNEERALHGRAGQGRTIRSIVGNAPWKGQRTRPSTRVRDGQRLDRVVPLPPDRGIRIIALRVSAPPSASASSSPTRRRLILLAKIVVSVALLWLLVTRSDVPRLWAYARSASLVWLGAALALYFLMVVASAWRWGLLLEAQGVHLRARVLTESFLVATFFNNFLPSNIGGDVVRIADTAKPARSRTLAASVVLIDRGIGLLGLVLVAAVAATVTATSGGIEGPVPSYALWLGFAGAVGVAVPAVLAPHGLERLLSPLRAAHPEWVGAKLQQLTGVFTRFREAPGALAGCFVGALVVQALLVAFYAAVAHSIKVPVSPWHMAVVVPMSFLVQMLPVSVNGFGLREATFSLYFTRLGLPIEAALVVSLVGAGLMMVFSLSGAAVYVTRGT
jgi:glycosyltransferase 2 family protein